MFLKTRTQFLCVCCFFSLLFFTLFLLQDINLKKNGRVCQAFYFWYRVRGDHKVTRRDWTSVYMTWSIFKHVSSRYVDLQPVGMGAFGLVW